MLMIIIYHDIGGAHSTSVAANIHINKLPSDRIPDKSELLALPTFDRITKNDRGHLIYIGDDEFGNKVYTISRQFKPNLVIPAIEDMYKITHGNTDGLYIVDTQPTVNTLMKIGGFCSRRLGLVSFGRPIVTNGSLKAYNKIADLVRGVKEQLKTDMENKESNKG